MNIPLSNNEEQPDDIYSHGFDKNLNRGFEDNSTGTVYDTIENAVNAGSVLSGGNLNLKTLSIGGLVRQVAPGDDINAAIDAVNREGGGVVQLLAKTYDLYNHIELKSNVLLVGAGQDVTFLSFGGRPYGVRCVGESSSIRENFGIKDLTILDSAFSAGIDIDYSNYFVISKVQVLSGTQKGVRVQRSQLYTMDLVECENNTGDGFYIYGDTNRLNINFLISNCLSTDNDGAGYKFESSGTAKVDYFTIHASTAVGSGDDSFAFITSSAYTAKASVVSCVGDGAAAENFDVDIGGISFLGCQSISATGDGFNISGDATKVMGCRLGNSSTGSRIELDLGENEIATVVACDFGYGTTLVPHNLYNETDMSVHSFLNPGASVRTDKRVVRSKNSSGGSLPVGAVTVFYAAAGGDEITTTTTNGDNKVFGMCLQTTADGNYGNFLMEGYTTKLYATNGTSSLSIGDWLSTYSHAYYAKKAVTGDMAFAIALEAPTTGTAQIDALLVSPRLI